MSVAVNQQPAAPPNGLTSAAQHLADTDEVLGSPAATSEGYSFIPLKQLIPSKTNPRKAFDEAELNELADSIRQHGVLQPILVRPYVWSEHVSASLNPTPRETEARYEIVCGERRYRAATRAGDGIRAIPAVIRDLSDQQALEIQIIENLQRKDVSALEEAEGFRQLLQSLQAEQPDTSQRELVQTIAQRIGKSIRYVYARMKLTELIPEVKQALLEGRIEASHADLLVRCDAERQQEVFRDYLFEYNRETHANTGPAVSVRQLRHSVESSAQELKRAAWKWKKDTSIEPLCTTCEKNTANQEGGDAKNARCLDEECFARKTKAFVEIRLEDLKSVTGAEPVKVCKSSYSAPKGVKRAEDWKKAAAGSCDSIVPGLLVNYEGEWEGAFPVCVNTKCEAHFGSAPESPEDAKRRAEREKLQAAVKRENEIRARMLEAVISQTTTLKPATLRAFVLHSVEFSPDCLDKVLPHSMTVLKKAKIDSPEFAKAVVGHLVGEHAEVSEYDGPDECKKEFHEQLGELGIDWKALRAKFETELYATLAAKEQPAKPKTPADLASLPVTPGWLSKTRKLPTKKAKAVAKKPAAKAAKKAAKKGSRK